MNEQGYQTRKRSTCQRASLPTLSCLLVRLPFLLDRLRALERQFFSLDRCDPAGLAAAQTKLLLLRYQIGVPVPDRQLRQTRLALEGFLEAGP